jgi:hypothetical protein
MTEAALPPITLSGEMRRELERKNVTDPNTIEAVARFETFLRVWGRPGEELPEDRKATARAMLADPEWREYLLGESDG